MQACFAFIGLILGTIPALFAQASSNKYSSRASLFACIRIKKIIPMIISFAVGIILIIFEKYFNINSAITTISSNPLYLVLAGFIMSIGIVVPGISNTIILMCLGVYSQYLSAIASVNLGFLIPIGFGVLIGGIVWLKLIEYLLEKYHESTFYAIIGFTLGSIFVLYPGFCLGTQGLISVALLIFFTILSYRLSKYELV